MGTRSCIAFYEATTGKTEGVYCHWDGYPEGIGTMLYHVSQMYDNLTVLRDFLFDHPSGYSSLTEWQGDPDLLIGYDNKDELQRAMSLTKYTELQNDLGIGIYYDGERENPDAIPMTEQDWEYVAFVYVIFPHSRKMRVINQYTHQSVIVNLAGEEPQWTTLMHLMQES